MSDNEPISEPKLTAHSAKASLSRRSLLTAGLAGGALVAAVGAGVREVETEWDRNAPLPQETSENIKRVASRISDRALTALHQRSSALGAEPIADPSHVYNLYVDGVVQDLKDNESRFNAHRMPKGHKKAVDEIVMTALAPALEYAAETGAGYFIHEVVQQYPQLKNPPFSLMSAIQDHYAQADGAKPDQAFPDASHLIALLNRIPARESASVPQR